MENKIFNVAATFYKSLVIRENELWLSSNKVSSLENFEKAVSKTGMMKSAFALPLSSINEVMYNEATNTAKINYTNEKSKDKNINIDFGDRDTSNQFGQYLGEKLGLRKSSVQEKQWKPLLLNALYFLIAIGMTIFLGTIEDTNTLTKGTSSRNRGRGAILKLLVDTIGQTGVLILGGLISVFFAYQLYNRFKNPSNEIKYTK